MIYKKGRKGKPFGLFLYNSRYWLVVSIIVVGESNAQWAGTECHAAFDTRGFTYFVITIMVTVVNSVINVIGYPVNNHATCMAWQTVDPGGMHDFVSMAMMTVVPSPVMVVAMSADIYRSAVAGKAVHDPGAVRSMGHHFSYMCRMSFLCDFPYRSSFIFFRIVMFMTGGFCSK